MTYEKLHSKAKEHGQEHLFNFWDELNSEEKENLLNDLREIDFEFVKKLHKDTNKIKAKDYANIKPPVLIHQKEVVEEVQKIGEDAIALGKLAVFILAGGQGSRLGFDGPKGCFEISPVKRKSLFQIFCEKILAAQRLYQTEIELYIMTSDSNHKSTVGFFSHNKYFGLKKEQVVFFKQRQLPSVNKEGKMLLKDKASLIKSPDGHGGCLNALIDNKIIERMEEKKIEYLSFINVDNPLVELVDPKFLGTHIQENSEISTKVVEKTYAEEKVGLVIMNENRIEVIEYVDLDPELAAKKQEDGKLEYRAGNINVFIINRDFIKRVEQQDLLEYIAALKKIEHLDENGKFLKPVNPNAYKFERFIFGILPAAKKTVTLQVAREEEFAPTKNAEGKDSPAVTRKMMTDLYKNWMRKAGINKEAVEKLKAAEISPLYAANEEEFVKKVKPKKEAIEKELKDKVEIYFE